MHLVTTWKSRPLSPEQFGRLLAVWGKLEERTRGDCRPRSESAGSSTATGPAA